MYYCFLYLLLKKGKKKVEIKQFYYFIAWYFKDIKLKCRELGLISCFPLKFGL